MLDFSGGAVVEEFTHQCRRNGKLGFDSLGREDRLVKETATYSSILAWEIPWTEETGGLKSMGLRRARHD